MSIKKEFEKQLLVAMKVKDETRKNVLRMVLSSIKLFEVESGRELDDPAIFNILQKEIKTREETIAEAEKANRPDMIDPLRIEILILKEYLPQEFSDAELRKLVEDIIEELKATSIKDMGQVMKAAISESQGKATNDRISAIVREILTTTSN